MLSDILCLTMIITMIVVIIRTITAMTERMIIK